MIGTRGMEMEEKAIPGAQTSVRSIVESCQREWTVLHSNCNIDVSLYQPRAQGIVDVPAVGCAGTGVPDASWWW